ncbi:hypothetical protein ABPG77_000096 [Micractinium sp. CCAP 211/92]
MASLSTSPQPFSGTYGHYHELTADDLPALRATNAQMMLVTLGPCSAFTPHYQSNCAEVLYVKSGLLDAVLLVDGERLQRTLRTGDVVAVPAGALQAFTNTHCKEAEALVLLASANPAPVFPLEQALSMPQQALISGFGLSNYSTFQDPINLPRSHLYSLNDKECSARCAARAAEAGNQTSEAAPSPTAAAGAEAPAPQQRRRQQQQPGRRLAAVAAPAAQARGRQLAQLQGHGGAAAGGLTLAENQQRASSHRQLLEAVHNDYMASLLKAPADVENSYATRRQLSHDELPGLGETDFQVALAELKACSMSALHLQPNADEFTTVLSGTIDMILLINSTRKVVRTMQPGDVAVIPRGVGHYFANANCDPITMLVLFNSKNPARVYPMTEMMALPSRVLTAAFGLDGGPEAYPSWRDTIDVPKAKLGSLNDPQCTARCEEASASELAAEEAEAGGADEGGG